MDKNINASAQAMKEMSRERARIFRKKTEGLSLLEQAALAWKNKKDAEERQRQKETIEKRVSGGLSFRETVAQKVMDYDKQKLATHPARGLDEMGWVQYKPWQKEEDKKEKQIPLNTATVVAIRKKLVAMEWARARGTYRKRQDTKLLDLEREAATWRQRKEEEKRRKEEIRMRIERHKEVLHEALEGVGKKLREKKDTIDPKELSALLGESLESAGEVFDIEWQESECLIWMEPWEEKKLRRISGLDIPIIYRVKIDENFQIASYEEVEDEEVIEGLKEELLTKPIRESLEEASFNIDNEEEAQQFLEDKLTDIGRLINLERTIDGWFATIEPWEEMRIRNVKRRGKPPIITDQIEIRWREGRLKFVPPEEEDEDENIGGEKVEDAGNDNQEKGGGKEDE